MRIVYFEQNMGMGFGRKFLTENFDTPYLYMMDDDILVMKEWLGPLLEIMDNHEDLGAVASIPLLNGVRPPIGGSKLEIRGDKLIRRPLTREEKKEKKIGKGLIPSDVVTQGCCLFRRKIFRDVNFDRNLICGTGGTVGVDFWLQVMKSKWGAAWCPRSTVNHRPWLCTIGEFLRRRLFRSEENLKSEKYIKEKYGLREIVKTEGRQLVDLRVKIRSVIDLIRGTLMTYLPF